MTIAEASAALGYGFLAWAVLPAAAVALAVEDVAQALGAFRFDVPPGVAITCPRVFRVPVQDRTFVVPAD